MTKRTITIWWLIGAGVTIVGGLLTLFCSLALVPHIQSLTNNFQPYITFVPDGYFWTLISFIILGCITILAGFIAQFVAWIGAVINTNHLVDKTWFNVLLWGGIVSIVLSPAFGLGALIWWGLMIAYLVGGPDGTAIEPMFMRATPPEQPKTLAPTG
jgi:hypothetical protein